MSWWFNLLVPSQQAICCAAWIQLGPAQVVPHCSAMLADRRLASWAAAGSWPAMLSWCLTQAAADCQAYWPLCCECGLFLWLQPHV
jgi:hypothetical protein